MKQISITRQAAPQVSHVQLREWQRYRGWTIKILEELEHSGGMTTRAISDRTGCNCKLATTNLCRMLKQDLVERVDRWGWRITVTGYFLLSLSLNHTTTTQQPHNNHTTTTQEQEETAPDCFHAKTCHIKQICQDKRYTMKTMSVCLNCVWNDPRPMIIPRVRLEKKAVQQGHD